MTAPAHGDDLALLLDTEQRLDRVLAEVRAEGDRLRAAATEEAARADELLATELAAERLRLGAALATEHAARLAELEQAAQADVDRWNGLRDAALEREARRLARRLVELASEAS